MQTMVMNATPQSADRATAGSPPGCYVCLDGQRKPGETLITRHRGTAIVVYEHVPALVCDTCGHAVLELPVVERLDALFAQDLAAGALFERRSYVAA